MGRVREVSPITSFVISTAVAPRHKVGKNILGSTELVAKTFRDPWQYWQLAMMGFVKGFNDGGPFKAVDIVRAPSDDLFTVLNDAIITVNRTNEEKPTKAPLGMAAFGWLPEVPAIYDGFRTYAAMKRSDQHVDFGRRSPFLAMTISDALKFIIPGSTRSLDVPVWEYQKTAQLVLADEMNSSFSHDAADINEKAAQRKYLSVLDAMQSFNPGGIAAMRENVTKIEAEIIAQKIKHEGGSLVEGYQITNQDAITYLLPQDQIRYVIGKNLVLAIDKAQVMRGKIADSAPRPPATNLRRVQ